MIDFLREEQINPEILEGILEFREKYPVAEDFKRMYDYIFALLTEANMKKDMELLERALEELRGMRDVWKEVMKRAKGPQLSLSTF